MRFYVLSALLLLLLPASPFLLHPWLAPVPRLCFPWRASTPLALSTHSFASMIVLHFGLDASPVPFVFSLPACAGGNLFLYFGLFCLFVAVFILRLRLALLPLFPSPPISDSFFPSPPCPLLFPLSFLPLWLSPLSSSHPLFSFPLLPLVTPPLPFFCPLSPPIPLSPPVSLSRPAYFYVTSSCMSPRLTRAAAPSLRSRLRPSCRWQPSRRALSGDRQNQEIPYIGYRILGSRACNT